LKRPKILSFICIIGYLSVVLSFPQVFSPQVKKLGLLMPALYGILVAANFIACVGIWYMKQWGVMLYLLVFFARILFNLGIDDLSPGFYITNLVWILFIIILIRFYPKMNPNL
jgi:hypothetical protein